MFSPSMPKDQSSSMANGIQIQMFVFRSIMGLVKR